MDTPLPQARLQGLLDAVSLIASELDPQVLLSRIAQAAADLVDARYAAVGVIADDGSLAQFVTVGMDPETVAGIGSLPHGDGVLGQLIRHPEPLRLSEVSKHPSAVGFPPGHPPMGTFLGVPVRVHDRVFGNLYLTDKREGEFDDQDLALISGLAAAVGISVENARLYERARRREHSSQAAAEITASLLSGADPETVLEVVAERAGDLVGADLGLIGFEHDNKLLVEVSWGTGGAPARALPIDADLASLLSADSTQLLSGALTATLWPEASAVLAYAVPLGGGLLVVGRCAPHGFTDEQLRDVKAFATQAGVALELAERRRDAERLSVFADRDRIARDLHDLVIQRLFATGMHLQASVAHIPDGATRRRVQLAVEDLDDTVREIRSTIYALSHEALAPVRALTGRLWDVIVAAQELLGFPLDVRLADSVDAKVPELLAEHAVGVVRESLSNVVRHAQARRVRVEVEADEALTIRVVDDGVGMSGGGRSSGLSNLEERARLVGGTFCTSTPDSGGTEVFWQAPLS